jgi:hypothetical protein
MNSVLIVLAGVAWVAASAAFALYVCPRLMRFAPGGNECQPCHGIRTARTHSDWLDQVQLDAAMRRLPVRPVRWLRSRLKRLARMAKNLVRGLAATGARRMCGWAS